MQRMKKLMTRIYQSVKGIVDLYLQYRISRSAAALSYYLIMSLFPLTVCITVAVTQFRLTENDVLLFIESLITDNLATFSLQSSNTTLGSIGIFIVALTLLVSSSAGAFRCLSFTAEEITGEKRFGGLFGTIFSYLFAFVLFLMVYAAIFLMIVWFDLLSLLERYTFIRIPEVIADKSRYFLIFAAFFAICFVLNFLMQPKDVNKRGLLPGTFFTAVGIAVVTVYFSIFIRGSAKYSLVYGSLASIILLLLWLYMCGNLLMIGVIINSVLHKKHRRVLPFSAVGSMKGSKG